MTRLSKAWRRTHYTKQINEKLTNEEITIMGWVHEIRDLGGIIFALIRDRDGIIQLTAPSKKVSTELLEEIRKLRKETVIGLKGIVQKTPKTPNRIEIIPQKIKIFNSANQPLPMDPVEKVKAEIDTRLDSRFLDLRKPSVNTIFKIKNQILHTIRTFFEKNKYLEVNTPKLVASAAEGGTDLFPITYFEKEAFLNQSPQLYKQMMMSAGFDKVYEIAQIFRAEEHDTLRHLNEAISIDIETSFQDDTDVMKTLNKLIQEVIININNKCQDELKTLGVNLEIPEEPFEVITYDNAIEMIKSKQIQIEWGEDLSRAAEKALGDIMNDYYFITEWPTKTKPFYVMPHEKNMKKSHSFDLMYKDLEISSGAMRIHQHKLLKEKITEKGLNPDAFNSYLKAFEYGIPPHAGWGLGAERLTMTLTGQKNIRETVLFPRDRKRITP